MELLVAIFGILAIMIAAILYGSLSWAFVFFKFYHWFILPVFANFQDLTFIQCLGITLTIGLFKSTYTSDIKKEYKEKPGLNMVMQLLMPWLVLIIGWGFKGLFFN